MRQPDELRPLSFELGPQVHADGSCLVKLGNTHVLCSACLEERVPPWMKGQGRGWITAEYGMLPGATHTRTDREAARGKQQGRTVEIQRLIGRSLRQAVNLWVLGERQITLDCDVLNADGGTRCASITGAWVALALCLRKFDLSHSLIRQITAVSAGILDAASDPAWTGRTGLLLDLEYEEDHRAAVDCNLVSAMPMDGEELEVVEFQSTGEGRSFLRDEAFAILDLGLLGCQRLLAAQSEVLE